MDQLDYDKSDLPKYGGVTTSDATALIKKRKAVVQLYEKGILKEKRLKSEVWNIFGRVKVLGLTPPELKQLKLNHKNPNDHFFIDGIVACQKCGQCYKYGSSHTSGTSTLKSHVCVERQIASTSHSSVQSCSVSYIIKNVSDSKPPSKIKVPKYAVHDCQDKVLDFILSQDLPFRTIDQQEFRKMLQHFVNLGSQFGAFAVNGVLCSSKTLRSKILSERYVSALAEFDAIKANVFGISFTLDIWQETFKQTTYVTLVVHYCSLTGCLERRVLCSDEFEHAVKTASDVRTWFAEKKHKFSLLDKPTVVVTDNDSNLIDVFTDEKNHVFCISHCLNLAIKMGIASVQQIETGGGKSALYSHDLHELFEHCKSVVTHLTRAELQKTLSKTLKRQTDEHWKSLYSSLNSINDLLPEICTILSTRNEVDEYPIDDSLLSSVVSLLKPFDDACTQLSSTTIPTLNTVVPWLGSLRNNLRETQSDSSDISKLKTCLSNGLREKIEMALINKWHFAATILDPRFKSSSLLSQQDRNTAIEHINGLINEFITPDLPLETIIDEGDGGFCDPFSDFINSSGTIRCEDQGPESINDDLLDYLRSNVNIKSVSTATYNPITMFWLEEGKRYTSLQPIALWILSIPASSTSGEKTFSENNWLINKRCGQLSPKVVNQSLVVKSFYKDK